MRLEREASLFSKFVKMFNANMILSESHVGYCDLFFKHAKSSLTDIRLPVAV